MTKTEAMTQLEQAIRHDLARNLASWVKDNVAEYESPQDLADDIVILIENGAWGN